MNKAFFRDILFALFLKCILIIILITGMKWLRSQESGDYTIQQQHKAF